MPAPLSGPGLGLQLPQNLYPSELTNAPYDFNTNQVALAGGQQLNVPAGTWYVSLGMYLFAEYLDPVTNLWTIVAAGSTEAGAPIYIKSDGFNWRIANRLGCPIGAVVLTGGSSYVQASTTITPSTGNSTWLPIVGGAYSVSSISTVGGGYGVPPLVIIPAPPPAASNPNGVGGRQAVAYAVIGSGTVTTVSMVDQGAGYPSGVTVTLVPNPTDPNIAVGITLATVVFSTTFGGSITGAICTNPGNPLATPNQLSLTVAGAGTNGTVAPVLVQTLTACSLSVGGLGWGVSTATVVGIVSGGAYPQGSIALSRETNKIFARPRSATVTFTITGTTGSLAAQSGAIVDGGIFFQQGNNAAVSANNGIIPGASAGTAGSIIGPNFVNTMGGSNVFDVAVFQPAP